MLARNAALLIANPPKCIDMVDQPTVTPTKAKLASATTPSILSNRCKQLHTSPVPNVATWVWGVDEGRSCERLVVML